MGTRIADDPDSWGRPADQEKRKHALRVDPSCCPSCGVAWMHHNRAVCERVVIERALEKA